MMRFSPAFAAVLYMEMGTSGSIYNIYSVKSAWQNGDICIAPIASRYIIPPVNLIKVTTVFFLQYFHHTRLESHRSC